MNTNLTKRLTPEEQELEKKKIELHAIQAELADRELELATLQSELSAFERRYLQSVGVGYAELDEIESQIATELARLNPKDQISHETAEKARAQARESAESIGKVKGLGEQADFKPSDDIKKLYREVAKKIHPDLANDENERAIRNMLMADANRAYQDGDISRLQSILAEWEGHPEAVKGEGVGAELVRIIRKIAQVSQRLNQISTQIAQLRALDLFKLKQKVDESKKEGRDLLKEMAEKLKTGIAEALRRLATLKQRGENR